VLVSGEREAILVDAQFGQREAQQVVEKIRASGKTLTTIYISHGDPDYYFGLETLHAAYPKPGSWPPRRPCNTSAKRRQAGLLGPQAGDNAPHATITPDVIKGHSLTLEGRKLEIVGLDGAQPDRSFVWIPRSRPWSAAWSWPATSMYGWPIRKA
jgi:glyoxylase-like metal-dependent hydrolase (beta-lactamase superfamily II)